MMVFASVKEKERHEEILRIKQLIGEGLNNAEIARCVGRGRDYIRDVRRGRARRPLMVDSANVENLYNAGVALSAIAKQLNMDFYAVRFRLTEAGYDIPAKEHKNFACKHSSSCFTCPLEDCKAGDGVLYLNRLDVDLTEEEAD